MHVVVDEGLPRSLAVVLRAFEVDAVQVREQLGPGVSDVDMLLALARPRSVLLTRNPRMWLVPHERALLRELEILFVVMPSDRTPVELAIVALQVLGEVRRLATEGVGARRFDVRRKGLTAVR